MIRPTLPQDLDPIRAFWNPMIRDTLVTFSSEEKSPQAMQDWFAARERAGHGTFTALIDGTPAGFASYAQFRGGNGYARSMEHTIILAPAAQGRGLGRALMAAIEDHARARGHHAMIGGVSGGNPAGRDFHLALGYLHCATVPQVGWKFGQFWDLWLLQKILT